MSSSQTFNKVGDKSGYSANRILTTDSNKDLLLVYPKYFIDGATRWDIRSNDNWVTWNRTTSFSGEIANQQLGSGLEPSFSWQDKGPVLPKGAILKNIYFFGRMNNNEPMGIQIACSFFNIDHTLDVSYDSVAEVNITPIITSTDIDMDGVNKNSNDLQGQIISLGDFVMPQMSQLNIAMRGLLTPSSNRQYRTSWKIEYELPLNLGII